MTLGKTMCDVGLLVADQCDVRSHPTRHFDAHAYVDTCKHLYLPNRLFPLTNFAPLQGVVRQQSPAYEGHKLRRVLDESKVTKARLLHYFPKTQEEVDAAAEAVKTEGTDHDAFSGWCGWHNDHGSLTALAPGMFFDENPADGGAAGAILTGSPDPAAGLYVRSRSGELVQVQAPGSDVLLFQIGETSQIHSGGVLQATPHAVRAAAAASISRTSFAVFMEPGWEESMYGLLSFWSTLSHILQFYITVKFADTLINLF
jgi:hypothetical protein